MATKVLIDIATALGERLPGLDVRLIPRGTMSDATENLVAPIPVIVPDGARVDLPPGKYFVDLRYNGKTIKTADIEVPETDRHLKLASLILKPELPYKNIEYTLDVIAQALKNRGIRTDDGSFDPTPVYSAIAEVDERVDQLLLTLSEIPTADVNKAYVDAGLSGKADLVTVDVLASHVDDLEGQIDTMGTQVNQVALSVTTKENTGVAAGLLSAHVSDPDPHSQYVLDTDPRLSDARLPIPHSHGTVTSSTPGFMLASDFVKLAGIQEGATENSPDSYLLDRGNHEGTQPIETITGLQTALDSKETSGTASNLIGQHLAASDPHSQYVLDTDDRLSDARVPLSHTHTVDNVTGLPEVLNGKASIGYVDTALSGKVNTNDPRLSDSRTPVSHGHPWSDIADKPALVSPGQNVSFGSLTSSSYRLGGDLAILPVVTGATSVKSWWTLHLGGISGTSFDTPSSFLSKDIASVFIQAGSSNPYGQSRNDFTTLVVRQAGWQTGHSQRWQNSSGTDIARVDNDGTLWGTSGAILTKLAFENDPRFTDARTPIAHGHSWGDISGKPTTVSGFGLTDVYDKTEVNSLVSDRLQVFGTPANGLVPKWNSITGRPEWSPDEAGSGSGGTAGVALFNGRAGEVIPQASDYSNFYAPATVDNGFGTQVSVDQALSVIRSTRSADLEYFTQYANERGIGAYNPWSPRATWTEFGWDNTTKKVLERVLWQVQTLAGTANWWEPVTTRIATAEKGQANGVATLGSDGKVPSEQLPGSTIGAGSISNTQISDTAEIAWSKLDKTGATPGDIGAATASQGGKADTALQPGFDLASGSSGTLPWNRVSVPSGLLEVSGVPANGQVPKWNAANSRAEWASDEAGSGSSGITLETNRRRPLISQDFFVAVGTTLAPFNGTAVSSGSLNAALSGLTTPHHPGVVRLRSSTTANSGYLIGSFVGVILLGGNEVFECVVNINTVGNTTHRLGFIDTNTSADCVDGVYFEVNASGVFAKTSSNSVRTTSPAIMAATVSTWYRFRIELNSNATQATFSIFNDAGTLLGSTSLSSNIPTATGRETGVGYICTNTGTTATDLAHLDYMAFSYGADLTR